MRDFKQLVWVENFGDKKYLRRNCSFLRYVLGKILQKNLYFFLKFLELIFFNLLVDRVRF